MAKVLNFLFCPPSDGRFKQAQFIFLALVFLMGGCFWWSFFECKEKWPFYQAIDWPVEYQYDGIIQAAYQSKYSSA
jgi:hypothetical protein